MTEETEVKMKEIQKKKIISFLPNHMEMVLMETGVKLYTSNKEGKNWLFSGLEGYLCFVLDNRLKTMYLILYDTFSFIKLFQYELYTDFHKHFIELAPEFRCFEIAGGFVGVQFEKAEDAQNFDGAINKFHGSFLISTFEMNSEKKEDEKNQKTKLDIYCRTLKQNFGSDSIYDTNYTEDGTLLQKARNFKIIEGITYNKTSGKFEFGHISDELKELFITFRIKKKNLENDADLAYDLIKKIIIGLSGDNKLKNNDLDNIQHTFPPPEERLRILKEEAEDEGRINAQKHKKTMLPKQKTKAENSVDKGKKQLNQPTTTTQTPSEKPSSNIPPVPTSSVPPVPPISISDTKVKDSAPEKIESTSSTSSSTSSSSTGFIPLPPPLIIHEAKIFPGSELTAKKPVDLPAELDAKKAGLKPPEIKEENHVMSMEEQLKSVTLKKAPPPKQYNTGKIITENENNYLQNALSRAIQIRRENLHQNSDDEDDDSDDDSWGS